MTDHPITRYHRQALTILTRAQEAADAGQVFWTRLNLRLAAPLETAAALLYARPVDAPEPQRSAICRSAATVCLAIGERRTADALCALALLGAPPPSTRAEIEALIVQRPLLVERSR